MIKRDEYLDKLIDFKDNHIIKVVTGIRRCGKSTLLKQFEEYLLDNGVDKDHIVFLNLDDIDNEELLDYKKLYYYIKSKITDNKMHYVILDEIQNVDNFQKAADSLFLKDNIDLYLTGSNSYMLSSEISTLLTGRYVLIEMMPLSFKEFASTFKDQTNLTYIYNQYLTTSSFPQVMEFNKDKDKIKYYLESIYNTIVLNDIINHKKVSDPMMLKSVLRFLFDNIGNIISPKKISDTMVSMNRKIDSRTIQKYIDAFLETYVVYEAKRYNVKGQNYLQSLSKYYICDIGLRYMLLGNKRVDFGHILENIIYLELIRRGYKVYVGQVGRMEVDFVCQDVDNEIYIQVALTTKEKETLTRELKPLKAINNNYPKLLLTLDEEPETNYDGIRKINALEWLIGRVN